MPIATPELYPQRSVAYLQRARAHLAEGDLEQAAEKGWGAAAVAVKACAESRGLNHNGHRQLWDVIYLLRDETGDPAISVQFGIAGQLHTNFYEGWLKPAIAEDYLDQVEELLDRLSALTQPG